MKLKHIIILQNKIDLVKDVQVREQHRTILDFVQVRCASKLVLSRVTSVVVAGHGGRRRASDSDLGATQIQHRRQCCRRRPLVADASCAQVVCEYIVNKIPIPLRDFKSTPRLIVIRSFDVNKVCLLAAAALRRADVIDRSRAPKLLSCAAAWRAARSCRAFSKSATRSKSVPVLSPRTPRTSPRISLCPFSTSARSGRLACRPIRSRILTLFAESNHLQVGVVRRRAPEPSLTSSVAVCGARRPDRCRHQSRPDAVSRRSTCRPGAGVNVVDLRLTSAQVLGETGKLPEIFTELEINFFLLRRLLGVKSEGDKKQTKVAKLNKGEVLMVNIGSTSTGAVVVVVVVVAGTHWGRRRRRSRVGRQTGSRQGAALGAEVEQRVTSAGRGRWS